MTKGKMVSRPSSVASSARRVKKPTTLLDAYEVDCVRRELESLILKHNATSVGGAGAGAKNANPKQAFPCRCPCCPSPAGGDGSEEATGRLEPLRDEAGEEEGGEGHFRPTGGCLITDESLAFEQETTSPASFVFLVEVKTMSCLGRVVAAESVFPC
uniref:Uncharacterized protein n=1 Tax=Oryza brachyantha TaxID=4533 RepID=J3MCC6_ORYBR